MMNFDATKQNILLVERIEKEYLSFYPHIKSWSISKIDDNGKQTMRFSVGKAKGAEYTFDLFGLLDLTKPAEQLTFEEIRTAISRHNAKGEDYFETHLTE